MLRDRPSNGTAAAKTSVAISFGSPASESGVTRLDLNDILIQHPPAAFLMRIAGSSMRDAGVDDGDLALVDRAMEATHGRVVIAVLGDEFICRRLFRRDGEWRLPASDPACPDWVAREDEEPQIWGVVTHVIRPLPAWAGDVCAGRCEQYVRQLRAGVPPVAERSAGGRAVEQRWRLHRPQQRNQGHGRADGPALVRGASSGAHGGPHRAVGQLRALRRRVQPHDVAGGRVRTPARDLQHRRMFLGFRRRPGRPAHHRTRSAPQGALLDRPAHERGLRRDKDPGQAGREAPKSVPSGVSAARPRHA